MLNRFQRILRSIGFMLISNSLMFTQIVAGAENGSSSGGSVGVGIVGALIGGGITAFILISKSRTKSKATKADEYKAGNLIIHAQSDDYLRTETTKVKINND